jgi:hypothetical protein
MPWEKMPFMGWFHLCFFTVFCQKIETALGLKGNEKTIKHFSYGHSAYLSISRQLSLIWKATLDRSIHIQILSLENLQIASSQVNFFFNLRMNEQNIFQGEFCTSFANH